jgi:hypothetical protein
MFGIKLPSRTDYLPIQAETCLDILGLNRACNGPGLVQQTKPGRDIDHT